MSVIRLIIETVTGRSYEVEASPHDTVTGLKCRIWKQEGIPPYHQALIYRGKALESTEDSISITKCGIRNSSRLKLIILARSGPLSCAPIPSASGTDEQSPFFLSAEPGDNQTANWDGSSSSCPVGKLFKHKSSRKSELESEETVELDLSFTESRRHEAKRRAEDNAKTRAKMREIQQNIERLRLEKKKCRVGVEPDIGNSGRRGKGTYGSPGKPKIEEGIRFTLLSAPEDTSAKESSAGETEYEESVASVLEEVGGRTEREDNFPTTSSSLPRPNVYLRDRLLPRYPPPQGRRGNSGGLIRVVSSSSEPESSGAIWTGSDEYVDEEEEGLVTAEEGVEDEEDDDPLLYSPNSHPELLRPRSVELGHPEVQVEDGDRDDAFFTGISEQECCKGVVGYCRETDPSELSSGMIICELANDQAIKRSKVQRKKHYVLRDYKGNQKQKITPEMTGTELARPMFSGRRNTKSTAEVSKIRQRSKPRPTPFPSVFNPTSGYGVTVGGVMGGGGVGKPRWSTTGESSSDEKERNKDSPLAVPRRSTSFGLLTHPMSRKTSGGGMRAAKHRSFGERGVENPVRNHKLPQSSQSQQRCMACGYRLTISTTFQCRCGKALCGRHKAPDMHTCSYDKPSRALFRAQEVSD